MKSKVRSFRAYFRGILHRIAEARSLVSTLGMTVWVSSFNTHRFQQSPHPCLLPVYREREPRSGEIAAGFNPIEIINQEIVTDHGVRHFVSQVCILLAAAVQAGDPPGCDDQ